MEQEGVMVVIHYLDDYITLSWPAPFTDLHKEFKPSPNNLHTTQSPRGHPQDKRPLYMPYFSGNSNRYRKCYTSLASR